MLVFRFSRPLLFLFCLILCGLSAKCFRENVKVDEEAMTVTLPDASKPFQTWVHLDRKSSMILHCEVIENTLNDTAKLGGANIAPNQLGLRYKFEWFTDSASFAYLPYKANKGKLKVRYYTKPWIWWKVVRWRGFAAHIVPKEKLIVLTVWSLVFHIWLKLTGWLVVTRWVSANAEYEPTFLTRRSRPDWVPGGFFL